MFWDRVAGVYDLFGSVYNGKVNQAMCRAIVSRISPDDLVLECACGTGMISVQIASKCRKLIATDYSAGMLKRAQKKCASFANVEVRAANILSLDFPDCQFDVVVAANVIHLLEDPYKALLEVDRVCKQGGRLIIPTYVNKDQDGNISAFSKAIGKAGADFRHQFTFSSYRAFFENAGYHQIEMEYIRGRVSCAVAVIMKE